MAENLKKLMEVQEIDLRIMSLCQEKASLPLEIERFEGLVRGIEDKKKTLEEENLNLIKERRQKELDLEGKNEARKKYQVQLYQLKSNKEYTALLQEIENVKKEIEKLEEEILALMQEIEDREKKIVEENKALDANGKELEEASKRNKEKMSQIDVILAEEEKHRGDKTSHIPKGILNEYEKIRKGRNGIGIVLIKNNACQGCFMELPPQVISETKLAQRLITCENCNRILCLDNETSID